MEIDPLQSDDLDYCLKEVELLSSMQHPNIVPYKDFFVQQDRGLVILIMEFCECKFPVLIIF
jgi:serine/threonine protein kinase